MSFLKITVVSSPTQTNIHKREREERTIKWIHCHIMHILQQNENKKPVIKPEG